MARKILQGDYNHIHQYQEVRRQLVEIARRYRARGVKVMSAEELKQLLPVRRGTATLEDLEALQKYRRNIPLFIETIQTGWEIGGGVVDDLEGFAVAIYNEFMDYISDLRDIIETGTYEPQGARKQMVGFGGYLDGIEGAIAASYIEAKKSRGALAEWARLAYEVLKAKPDIQTYYDYMKTSGLDGRSYKSHESLVALWSISNRYELKPFEDGIKRLTGLKLSAIGDPVMSANEEEMGVGWE